ncbi:MAG: CHAP domain-containing protein [Candidatus Dormibacteria bacterium]
MKLQCCGAAAGCLLLPLVGIPILVAGFSTLTQSAATEDSNQVSVAFPPADQLAGFATAAQTTGVPEALLMALAAQTSGMTFNAQLVSALGLDGSPSAYGEFQMEPATFTSAGEGVGLAPVAFIATSDTGSGADWGEPQGELDAADEALAAAQVLEDQGATGAASQAELEAAVAAYLGGAPATTASASPTPSPDQATATPSSASLTPTPGQTTATATSASPTPTPAQSAETVVTQYMPIYQAWITAGEPAMGGSAPDCPSGRCEVAATTGVFPWVPAAGFTDYYQPGQCTYWAARNFDPFPAGVGGGSPQNLGNGGEWYATAAGKWGLATLPPSVLPPYGSAVSYAGFPGDSGDGHVAVVISDDANGEGYWVSEMNVLGLGVVDVAHEPFPDPYLQGSVLAPQASAWAAQ